MYRNSSSRGLGLYFLCKILTRPLNKASLCSGPSLYFTAVHANGTAMKDHYIVGHVIRPISESSCSSSSFPM